MKEMYNCHILTNKRSRRKKNHIKTEALSKVQDPKQVFIKTLTLLLCFHWKLKRTTTPSFRHTRDQGGMETWNLLFI